MNSVTLNNISSKSKRFAPLNCKYIGIRKLEYGEKTQFLYVALIYQPGIQISNGNFKIKASKNLISVKRLLKIPDWLRTAICGFCLAEENFCF